MKMKIANSFHGFQILANINSYSPIFSNITVLTEIQILFINESQEYTLSILIFEMHLMTLVIKSAFVCVWKSDSCTDC